MVTTETLIEKCEMLRYSGIAEELKHLPPDFFTENTIYDALNHFLDVQLADKKARQINRLRSCADRRNCALQTYSYLTSTQSCIQV